MRLSLDKALVIGNKWRSIAYRARATRENSVGF